MPTTAQQATYRSLVEHMWSDGRMVAEEVTTLTTMQAQLGLTCEDAATIEREVIGMTKEEALVAGLGTNTPPPTRRSSPTPVRSPEPMDMSGYRTLGPSDETPAGETPVQNSLSGGLTVGPSMVGGTLDAGEVGVEGEESADDACVVLEPVNEGRVRPRLQFEPAEEIEQHYPGHLYLLNPDTQTCIPLERPVVRIGRGQWNDLDVDYPHVSRRHLVVATLGRRLVAINCGLPEKVKLNNQPLIQSGLGQSDQLQLPGLTLVLKEAPGTPRVRFGCRLFSMSTSQGFTGPNVVMGNAVPTLEEDEPIEQAVRYAWVITCYRGQARGATHAFVDSRAWILGTDSKCDLRIVQEGVGARHLRLSASPHGIMAEVLGGTPIKVNGRSTTRRTLHRGDTFTLGKGRFIVHLPLDYRPMRRKDRPADNAGFPTQCGLQTL